MEFIWKIKHVPTGLFYCSKKGRFKDEVTNLSKKGNHYTSEKVAEKILKQDCNRANINAAQTERFNLPLKEKAFRYNEADLADFKIEKYQLILAE